MHRSEMARRTMDNVRSEGRVHDVVDDDDDGFFLGDREATYNTNMSARESGVASVSQRVCHNRFGWLMKFGGFS